MLIGFNPSNNVAGIPWIVAADKGLPEFYHYTCANDVLLERKLLFPRQIVNGMVATNQPPAYTNQFYCMAMSNTFGMDAWNPYPTPFNGVNGLSYFSNYVTLQLTNEYNYGFTTNLIATTAPLPFDNIAYWRAGGGGANTRNGFLQIENTNIISVPGAYYSETLHRFYFVTNAIFTTNSFLASDMAQRRWPVYNWTLNVTNHVVYALFDGPPQKGALLDFVNLGPFGTSLSLTNGITQINFGGNGVLSPNGSANTANNYWAPGLATSLPGSPMSQGVLNQITNGETFDPKISRQSSGARHWRRRRLRVSLHTDVFGPATDELGGERSVGPLYHR